MFPSDQKVFFFLFCSCCFLAFLVMQKIMLCSERGKILFLL